MSIESDATAEETTDDGVDTLARELGEAITEMPVYQRFLEHKETVESDDEAQAQIQEFEQIREEFMVARQTGQATQEDLRELQDAQEELHSLPVMSDYLEAKSEMELRLQELNEVVSEPLVLDFGESAGGCCQDE